MSVGEQIEAVYNDFAFDNRLLARAREAEFARDLERDLGYDVPPRNKGISNRAKNRRIINHEREFITNRGPASSGMLTMPPARFRTAVPSRVHEDDATGWVLKILNDAHASLLRRGKKPCP